MKKSKRLVSALGVPAFVLVLIFGAATPAPAEVKIDLGLNIPYYTGVKVDDEDAGEAIDWLFLLPDAQLGWFQELGPVRVAPGVRLWTLIVQSVVYPTLTLEQDVGPVLLRAGAGMVFLFAPEFSDLGSFGYTATLFARYTIRP